MIHSLFREINYLFARIFIIFICYLILINRNNWFLKVYINSSKVYIYYFLFCDYGIVIYAYLETSLYRSIFFYDDGRNLDMLQTSICKI